MYPTILGDAGPSYKMGEASLRLCNEIKNTGNPLARPVSDLTVTYLVFPGSADPQRSAPDLDRWYARCAELLTEIGAPNAPLHRWENNVPPWPTPTPSPTPSPSPTSGTPVVDTGAPAESGAPATSAPTLSPTPQPGVSPTPSPTASPGPALQGGPAGAP